MISEIGIAAVNALSSFLMLIMLVVATGVYMLYASWNSYRKYSAAASAQFKPDHDRYKTDGRFWFMIGMFACAAYIVCIVMLLHYR